MLSQHQSTYSGGPESVSFEIPPLRPHFINFSKTVFCEVNLVSQCLHLEVLLLSKFVSARGHSINADSGPLGMYFDAVVAEVKTFLLLFRLTLAIL